MSRYINILAALTASAFAFAVPAFADQKPTVVLVHGAFAESNSWNSVVRELEKDGYPVVGAANPLRSVKGDAEYVSAILSGIKGPVVLVGHSYGGSVISNAANGHDNVKALVYVAAFAPEAGETAFELTGKFPGSTLGPTLAEPVTLPDGGHDLYIKQDEFPKQFAADVPLAEAKLMAAGQRPVAEAALKEPAGTAAWKTVPSWFVYGDADKNIPPLAMAWMADRAKSQETVVVKGASHVLMVSHPEKVSEVIETAARSVEN